MSAGRQRNMHEGGSSLTTAGLNQLNLSPNPNKMPPQSLNQGAGAGRPPLRHTGAVLDSTEARRREISDQVFNEVMDSQRNSDFKANNSNYGPPPHTSTHLPSKSVNLPNRPNQAFDLPPHSSHHQQYALQSKQQFDQNETTYLAQSAQVDLYDKSGLPPPPR